MNFVTFLTTFTSFLWGFTCPGEGHHFFFTFCKNMFSLISAFWGFSLEIQSQAFSLHLVLKGTCGAQGAAALFWIVLLNISRVKEKL